MVDSPSSTETPTDSRNRVNFFFPTTRIEVALRMMPGGHPKQHLVMNSSRLAIWEAMKAEIDNPWTCQRQKGKEGKQGMRKGKPGKVEATLRRLRARSATNLDIGRRFLVHRATHSREKAKEKETRSMIKTRRPVLHSSNPICTGARDTPPSRHGERTQRHVSHWRTGYCGRSDWDQHASGENERESHTCARRVPGWVASWSSTLRKMDQT